MAVIVAKYNNTGKCLRAFNIGGKEGDQGFGITSDTKGYIYITGNFSYSIKLCSANYNVSGETDVFVAKYKMK